MTITLSQSDKVIFFDSVRRQRYKRDTQHYGLMKKWKILKNKPDGLRKERQARFTYELLGKKVKRKPTGQDFEVSEPDAVTGETIW